MVSSLTKHLTNQQLIDMSPGGRIDAAVTAPWQIHVFALLVGKTDWEDKGVQFDTRAGVEGVLDEVVVGLKAMVTFGLIQPGQDGNGSFIPLCVPKGWAPGDPLFYPPSEEIAEERAARGI